MICYVNSSGAYWIDSKGNYWTNGDYNTTEYDLLIEAPITLSVGRVEQYYSYSENGTYTREVLKPNATNKEVWSYMRTYLVNNDGYETGDYKDSGKFLCAMYGEQGVQGGIIRRLKGSFNSSGALLLDVSTVYDGTVEDTSGTRWLDFVFIDASTVTASNKSQRENR
jgi:hypothetical protein